MEVIHIVLGKANPNRSNGVNKVVYNLASEQAKAEKNVEVWGITPHPNHNYPERNFTTHLFQASAFPFQLNAVLKKQILQRKEAVYHLHGGWIPVFFTLAQFLKKHHIKFILTPHGAYNQIAMKKNKTLKAFYFRFFEKKILKNAYRLHAIGKSEVTSLKQLYPNQITRLLPYGFEAQQQALQVNKPSDFTIGFIGRLDVHTKGLDLLLHAFHNFQNQHKNSKLWIIGGGDGLAYVEAFKAEMNLNNITIWGEKYGNEKEALLAQMHVFAHPSRNEGLPTSVLEAAAFEVPTLVSEATNLGDIISQYKAGITIENECTEALIEGLDKLYKAWINNTLTTYGKAAKLMLEEGFNWPKLVEKYELLYA